MCRVWQVNGRVVFDVRLPMHYSEISALTEHEALSLAQQHGHYEAVMNNKPVLEHQLIVDQESLSVDLHLTVEAAKRKKIPTHKRSRADRSALS